MTPTDEFFLANKGLAYAYVRRLLHYAPALRHLRRDLQQEALVGVLRASQTYDPARSSFSTYGWVGAALQIRRALPRMLGAVRGPLNASITSAPVMVPLDFSRLPTLAPDACDLLDISWESARAALINLYREAYGPRALGQDRAEAAVDCFLVRLTTDAGDRLRSGTSIDAVAKKHGFTRERGRQLANRVVPLFDRWAEMVRQEAA